MEQAGRQWPVFHVVDVLVLFTTIRGERKKGEEHLAIKVNGQFAIGDE